MTGPEHYSHAEELLATTEVEGKRAVGALDGILARAQVHATLALTAASIETVRATAGYPAWDAVL